ncbi:hypothetical protein [Pelagicoccus albus]|uniref:Uncharacterized protein n=1 Tax=Pelagicoccus albus TaxID=415222 RepID=A0A7X1B4T8_9BACT|nr:hypothetical protein [Pelagicoccus albus]MBC2605622.1 hypothetical protein [Pelagicoccus albus]
MKAEDRIKKQIENLNSKKAKLRAKLAAQRARARVELVDSLLKGKVPPDVDPSLLKAMHETLELHFLKEDCKAGNI